MDRLDPLRDYVAYVIDQHDDISVSGLAGVIVEALFGEDHQIYLSTGCLHGEHEHCCNSVSIEGQPKVPGRCKFCSARCVCPCHETDNPVSKV